MRSCTLFFLPHLWSVSAPTRNHTVLLAARLTLLIRTMFLKSLIWTLVAVSVLSLTETKTLSRRRQLRHLQNPEDQNSTKTLRQFDPRWTTGQAKIARVRTADGRSLKITEDLQNLDLEKNASFDQKVDLEKNSNLEPNSDGKVGDLEKDKEGVSFEFQPRKFHCKPIQDTHVPKINKTLPAYMCKLNEKQFVLTSEKFVHDRKSHVDVSIDEATFLRLSKVPANRSEVIPAMLVFNKEGNIYGIKRT